MSEAESAGAESFGADSAASESSSSTASAVPSADADSASDPSSSSAFEADGDSHKASSSSSADDSSDSSGSEQGVGSDHRRLTSDQQLCEVGTFAQVHTIVPIDPKRAQLLLLGHRRLKRTKQVSLPAFRQHAYTKTVLQSWGHSRSFVACFVSTTEKCQGNVLHHCIDSML